eukprot:GHVT01027125.1.p1 GENE.GHVT01027125.1~~GHVT01027125.1.p1  ORF type:complete len:110 (-),score=6.56 GHVT01027125.1:19-348(-)
MQDFKLKFKSKNSFTDTEEDEEIEIDTDKGTEVIKDGSGTSMKDMKTVLGLAAYCINHNYLLSQTSTQRAGPHPDNNFIRRHTFLSIYGHWNRGGGGGEGHATLPLSTF